MSSGSNAKRSSGHLDKSASRITESATCCCLLTSLVNDKGSYHSLKSRERERERSSGSRWLAFIAALHQRGFSEWHRGAGCREAWGSRGCTRDYPDTGAVRQSRGGRAGRYGWGLGTHIGPGAPSAAQAGAGRWWGRDRSRSPQFGSLFSLTTRWISATE